MSSDLYIDSQTTLTRLIKRNSVDFVRRVFELYSQRKLFVLDKEEGGGDAAQLGCEFETIVPQPGGGWFEESHEPVRGDSAAQIIFSSGTEGRPKAIVISHDSLANVSERLVDRMHMDSTVREYICVPVSYSFGLGRCRAVAAAGGKSFIPEQGFNLKELAAMLEADEINAISAVPSIWRVILNNAELIGSLGSKVKWIEIGSQYMSAKEKVQMVELFPQARILQHYGLTEASRSTFLDISTSPVEHYESVGKIVDGIDISLSPDNRIKVRGPHVAMGRIVDGKLVSLADEDGWLTTSDVGHIKEGYLYYDGRFDDIVNCSGVKIDPEHLQQSLNASLAGRYTVAVAGVPDKFRGEGFLVAVDKPEFDQAEIHELADRCLAKLGVNASDAIHVQFIESIPKTDTGKVQRKRLSGLYRPAAEVSSENMDRSSISKIFQGLFPARTISAESSFRNLGGDSLSYVQAAMEIEKKLGVLPLGWEDMSVAQLEAITPKKAGFFRTLEMGVVLRAVAISCVVISHAGFRMTAGGTILLLFLVGLNFGRFQSRNLLNGAVWGTLAKFSLFLLVPYYMLSAIDITRFGVYWDRLLLMTNLVSIEHLYSGMFPYWFVQVLIQILIIIGVFFSIPKVRTTMSNYPWVFSFLILMILVAQRLLYPVVWDTSYVNDSVPNRYLVIFWLGFTAYFCSTVKEKIAVAVTAVFFAVADNYLSGDPGRLMLWLLVGPILVLFIPQIKLPRMVSHLVEVIAAATFYIFAINSIAIKYSKMKLGLSGFWELLAIGMLSGVAGWYIIERLRLPGRIYRIYLDLKGSSSNLVS